MNFLNSKIKKYLCRLFAFIAPAMILTITFMLKRITPFGDNMIVSSDLEIQIVPFLTELSDKLRSGTSLMFSHRRTLGYDFICESAYYLTSPLNIFCVFFNAKTMPTFITLLLIVKSGLAGLTMNIYLNNHFNKYKNKDCIITIAFSSCYALCAYLTDYYILIMWLDVMIMLPLVILALESLIQYKKKYIYSIMLAIAIFCNYYIGFMLCIFVTLYFAYYLVAEYKANNYKDYLLIIKNFIIYSLLGGGLAAFILLPEIHALMGAASVTSSGYFFESLFETKTEIVRILYNTLLNSYPKFTCDPKLYSGVITLLLLLVYFFCNKINSKERGARLLLILLIMLSFYLCSIEYIWNGFHKPTGFSCRNSFIFSFLVIITAYKLFTVLDKIEKKVWLISLLILLVTFYFVDQKYAFSIVSKRIIINMLLILIYAVICYIYAKKHSKLYLMILSVLILCELTFSSYYTIPAHDSGDYQDGINTCMSSTESIDTSNPNRIVNLVAPYANFENLCGYNGFSNISSVSNDSLNSLLSNKGLFSGLNSLCAPSYEPVLYSLLGANYIVSPYKIYTNDLLINTEHDNDNYYVYKNPYAVTFGFLDRNTNYLHETSETNPFEQINAFAGSYMNIYGESYKIYEKYDFNYEISNDEQIIYIEEDKDIYIYNKKELTYSVFHSKESKNELYHNDITDIFIHIDIYNDNYVYHIPQSVKGGYITLPKDIDIASLNIYTLNEKNYSRLMGEIKESEAGILTFEDTYIKAAVNLKEEGTYITSLPYSKGFSIYIDGKYYGKGNTNNALLCFDIPKGEHIIEIKYVTPYFIQGVIISCFSLILLILLSIFTYRRQNHEFKK